MVDSNLNAAGNNDAPQPDRARSSQRDAGNESQANQRTGMRHRPQDQAEPARQTSSEATSRNSGATEDDATETPAVTLEAQVAVATTASAEADHVETTADTDADDTQAAGAAAPTTTTTGIVAVAVTMQIELAGETSVPVIDSGDTVSNPPATIASAPAGTAASALARVAADTADAQTTVSTTTETGTQAPTDPDAQDAAATTPETAPAQANSDTTDAAAETTTESPVAIETAEPQAQINAKAQAELTATAKADPTKPTDQPSVTQIVANADPKPATASARNEAKAPEQPASPKAETRDERRVEAGARNNDQPSRTPEAETRPAQRPAHEPTAAVPAHAQAANNEQQQPTGFGLSHTATTQLQAATVQTAQLTAIPVAANMPVPVSGLAVEIAANAQIGRSRFDIRLDPPELGRIDVRLDVDQKGQVTSHLIVEKSATLDLLRRDAQQLERALQDAGLKTSDNGLQFSLRDQQQQTGRNDDQGSGRNAQRLIVTDEDTVVAETAGRSYGRMASLRGGIDIRV
jgi:chemotaxis protein MotD